MKNGHSSAPIWNCCPQILANVAMICAKCSMPCAMLCAPAVNGDSCRMSFHLGRRSISKLGAGSMPAYSIRSVTTCAYCCAKRTRAQRSRAPAYLTAGLCNRPRNPGHGQALTPVSGARAQRSIWRSILSATLWRCWTVRQMNKTVTMSHLCLKKFKTPPGAVSRWPMPTRHTAEKMPPWRPKPKASNLLWSNGRRAKRALRSCQTLGRGT